MSTNTKKHGVHITEHSSRPWNTKTIYSRGHVMRTYRRVPRVIRFQSPMVNDFNQDLCNGWFMDGIGAKEVNEQIIDQLIKRKKPFGVLSGISPAKADEAEKRLKAAGLIVRRQPHAWAGKEEILAAQPMRVEDIGDLKLLVEDYRNGGVIEMFPHGTFEESVFLYGEKPLSYFFEGWDSPDVPTWVAGLILGYPIENTISIYLQ